MLGGKGAVRMHDTLQESTYNTVYNVYVLVETNWVGKYWFPEEQSKLSIKCINRKSVE